MGISLLGAFLFVPDATAATRFWKGTGTWTAASQWGSVTGGPYTLTWAAADDAVFDVASSTVTGASSTFTSITANQNVTMTAGGTLNPILIAPVTVASTMTFNFNGQSLGTTAGTGINKKGAGTLAMGGASAYPGGFTLDAGTVTIGGVNSLGVGPLVINGGILRSDSATARDLSGKPSSITVNSDFALGDAVNTGLLTFTAPMALGAATRTITLNSAATFGAASVISGSAGVGLTKAGASTLTLSGANTYTGPTSISAGTLSVNTFPNGGVAGALGMSPAASANLIIAGGTLSYSGVNATTDRGLTLNGNGILTVASSTANLNIGGVIAGGSIDFTKGGGGTLTLSGLNTHTGRTFVSGGTLAVNTIKNAGVICSLGVATTPTLALISIGTGTATTTLSYIGAGDSSDRVINLPGTSGGATLDQSGASGLWKFTSPLTATGVGSKTLTLQGSAAGTGEIGAAIVNNSTTGTTVSTLASSASTSLTLGSVDGLTVGNAISGTGIAGGTTITAINTGTKVVTLSAAATVALGATITSAGLVNRTSLTKAGSGTWTLSGASTYTGPTTVNGGTLALGFGAVAANILPASSALTLGGGTLQLTGTGTQTANGLTTTASTSSQILLGANETLTLGALTAAGAGSSLNFNTVAGGANGATVGNGIVGLTGLVAGNVINSGFTVSDVGGFGLATVNGSAQVVRRTTGATLLPATGATSATDYSVDNNAGGSAADGSSSLVITASEATKSFTVDTTTASGVLTLNSGVVLSGNLWHFGGAGVNTYQITGSAVGAGLKSLVSGDAISLNNYNPSVVTIASPILANGVNAVNLNGSGTTVFSGNNTYTGLTTVRAGTLKVTGGTSVIGALSVGAATYQQDSSSSVSSVTLTGTSDLNIGTAVTGAFTLNAGTFADTGSPAAAGNIGLGAVTTFTQTGGLFSYAPSGGNVLLNMGVSSGGSVTLNLSGGTFQTAANVPTYLGGRTTTDMNISGTALVDVPNFIFNRNLSTAHTATLNLGDGTLGSGTLKVSTITKESAAANNVSIFNFNGGTLKAGVPSATFMSGLTTASVKDGGAIIDSDTFDITIGQALLHFAGATTDSLTKIGTGKLTLTNANTYTGNTTVSNGTLALSGSGSIATSPNLIVVGGATLDVTAVSGGFTLAANQTLKGNGTVTGPITINGTLSPGASIGTLTLNGAATNNGTILAEITNGPSADKIVFSGGFRNNGGTLTVTSLGTLVNGTTYDLFDFSSTPTGVAFAATNLPGGLSHWNTTDLLVGGTITFANNAPVAANFGLGVAVGGTVSSQVIGKFASDADTNDVLTITVLSAPANGMASIVGGTNITYVSTNSAAGDSFTYTVSDGLASATATVTVSTYSPEGFNRISPLSVINPGTVAFTYLGIPGYNYALDWATNLTPPINWMGVVTNTAAGNGSLNYTNTSTEPVNFFRTRYVP